MWIQSRGVWRLAIRLRLRPCTTLYKYIVLIYCKLIPVFDFEKEVTPIWCLFQILVCINWYLYQYFGIMDPCPTFLIVRIRSLPYRNLNKGRAVGVSARAINATLDQHTLYLHYFYSALLSEDLQAY
jgi:hypothetical protein